MHVLAYISTKGRTQTSLPLAISSIINQTRRPDQFILFDDNTEPTDLRTDPTYEKLFQLMDNLAISWQVVFGRKMGQHHNHEIAQSMAKEIAWRVDDDCIAAPNVLELALKHFRDPKVGAVGGSVLTPPYTFLHNIPPRPNSIHTVFSEPNIQWFQLPPNNVLGVDHLHCTYVYRKGLAAFNLALSPVAHTEESTHTFEIRRAGYKVLVDTNIVTYHLKLPSGGIRNPEASKVMYDHDTRIWKKKLIEWGVWDGKIDNSVAYLDCGIGDHYVFRHFVLPKLIERHGHVKLGVCFPDVFNGISEVEVLSLSDVLAKGLIKDANDYNVYAYMMEHPGLSLQQCFEGLYHV